MIPLSGNRSVVEARFPRVAARMDDDALPERYQLGHARDGSPALSIGGWPLHNLDSPTMEAARWAAEAAEKLEAGGVDRAIVVGLGLGYHVEALCDRFDGAVVVVEPDPYILAAALGSRDLSSVLNRLEALVGSPSELPAGAGKRSVVLVYAPAMMVTGAGHREAADEIRGALLAAETRLKFLVVAPVEGGSHPIALYSAAALRRLGHEVELLDMASFVATRRSLDGLGLAGSRRDEAECRMVELLSEAVAGVVERTSPDVVLALAQAPLVGPALDAIGRAGAIRAFWFVEDHRLATYWEQVVPHYDAIFTIQEGECLEAMGRQTGGAVSYLPCGFAPEIHRPLVLSPEERQRYASDVSFVGAGYRNRRRAFNSFLDLDFRIWGSDWGGALDLGGVLQRDGARISTEESVRIFNATQVNLNLHSSTYHDGVDPRGDFVNPRTFELAGCGALQIVDRRSLMPDLFEPGRELVVVDSVAEMREQTAFHLAHPEARVEVIERARERALAAHTYEHRMQSLVQRLFCTFGDRLQSRPRPVTIDEMRVREGGELGEFLQGFDGEQPFTLEAIVRSVPERRGPISDPEAIFLFLHQFDELYLQEYRQR